MPEAGALFCLSVVKWYQFRRPSLPHAATRALLLPDLLAHDLTGEEVAERTIAGTTALVDVQSGTWSAELIADLGLPLSLFPSIVPPTTRVGKWSGVPVHAVGGHDTASAVVALPGPP